MKLIDKDALVAEIARRIKNLYPKGGQGMVVTKILKGHYEDLLSFLDTLEAKEVASIWNDARKTIPEDSSNQIICIKEDDLAVVTIGKLVSGTKKWAYLGDLLDTNSFNVEAKGVDLAKELDSYFAKFKGLEKSYWNWRIDTITVHAQGIYDFAKHFFELGLKVQKDE